MFAYTNLTFIMDGQISSKPFFQQPTRTANGSNINHFNYNSLVYSQTGLSNDSHTLQVCLATQPYSSERTAFVFDYAIYTYVILALTCA
jgi:hypothetical protein